jgi:hypothetical protein
MKRVTIDANAGTARTGDVYVNTRTGEQFEVTATPGPETTWLSDAQWEQFCEHHGQDPDDPDAFRATPPNRLRRMMAEFFSV